jgi:general secretion pathway protein K
MKSFHTQKGVALITALLIVALATILTVAMTSRQQLDIRRTANLINREQAYMYALGGENWTKQILLRDAKNNQFDSFNDIWATPMPPLPILGGTVQGHVEDLQGRFNLNNLIKENQISKEDFTLFERLLQILELPPKLAQIVVDWIDNDMEPQLPYGAEDNTYLIQKHAYRTSNTLLSSPTEIRLLSGFEQKNYQKLLPHISTLPTRTPINLNTATLEILMALVEGLSDFEAQTLIASRDKKPFESVEDFLVHDALAGLSINANNNLSVSSDYFFLTVQVQIARTQIQLNSILHRLPNKVEIVLRSQGLID